MDIIKKIADGENITTEFKECRNRLPKNLFETICAFLNRMGGDIFLGVADDGAIIGVEESCVPQLKKDISSLCNNANKIAPTVYLHIDECEIEGKTVLHIYVPESSQVHSTAGKIYDRNEDGDYEITGNSHLVAQMYIRKQREFTENTIYPYATLNDLESETIREVRIMAVNRQPNHPWEKLTDEELLKSCGLYKRDLQTGESGYTLACILLFGKDETILSAIPYFKTDAVYRKENLDRYDDRDEIKCNFLFWRRIYFLICLLIFFLILQEDRRSENISILKFRKFSGIDLRILFHIPHAGTKFLRPTDLFEHTCYHGILRIRVEIIQIDNAITAGIVAVFRRHTICCDDQFCRICARILSVDQQIRHNFTEQPIADIYAPISVHIKFVVKMLFYKNHQPTITFNQIALDLIRRNGKITRASLSEKTGYSKATIDRLIKSLKEKGYIKGRTSDKGGNWIL